MRCLIRRIRATAHVSTWLGGLTSAFVVSSLNLGAESGTEFLAQAEVVPEVVYQGLPLAGVDVMVF
jgi:hypothetical protein